MVLMCNDDTMDDKAIGGDRPSLAHNEHDLTSRRTSMAYCNLSRDGEESLNTFWSPDPDYDLDDLKPGVHTRDCESLRRNSTVANKPFHDWAAYTVTTLSRPGDSLKPPPDRKYLRVQSQAERTPQQAFPLDATTK